MNLRQTIKQVLNEELSLPNYVKRRVDLDEDNVINLLKASVLDMSGRVSEGIDVVIKRAVKNTSFDLLDAAMLDFDNESTYEVVDILSEYLEEKYGEQMKEYIKNFYKKTGDDIGSTYVFHKHAERYGGSGFSEGFETWNKLLKKYASWFPDLNWYQLKEKLDNMRSGESLLIKRPNDKNNTMGYYFSIKRIKNNEP